MITVTILAVALLTAALIGALVLVRLATTREHRDGHLPTGATTWLTGAARSITGLYVEVAEPRVQASCDRTLIGAGRCGQAPDMPGDDTRHMRNDR
ncbi:MAG: hypothetical protein ACR2MP_13775 [Streptosporangiaceae bacterium]